MADFIFFAELPPILLEQIIYKLHWKNFCHLQRACRQMKEFIHTSRKLYTRVEKNANFKCIAKPNGRIRVQMKFQGSKIFTSAMADIADLYGLRVRILGAPGQMERGFPKFCQVLRKHRITCSHLRIMDFRDVQWTKEQCIELIKTLKPEKIEMKSSGSNRFEALEHSRNLARLDLSGLDPLNIISIMENVTRYRGVGLTAKCLSINSEELATVIYSVCQILRSESRSHWNLDSFHLKLVSIPHGDFHEQLIRNLQTCSFSLFGEVQAESKRMRHYIDPPGSDPFSYFIIDPVSAEIVYHKNYYNMVMASKVVK